jgi:hypothetical protein
LAIQTCSTLVPIFNQMLAFTSLIDSLLLCYLFLRCVNSLTAATSGATARNKEGFVIDYKFSYLTGVISPSMEIDLTDPALAERLLRDDSSQNLSLEVFKTYIRAFPDVPNPKKLSGWIFPALAPEVAIELTARLVWLAQAFISDASESIAGITAEDVNCLSGILKSMRDLLIRGQSRKRGRPPELKRKAVIAFVLKHYTSLTWPEIADRVFVVCGECTRCNLSGIPIPLLTAAKFA